jgi:hypothetical protein
MNNLRNDTLFGYLLLCIDMSDVQHICGVCAWNNLVYESNFIKIARK